MTKVVVVNGPNLGRLGVRQPDVYGKQDLETLRKLCTEWGHSCRYILLSDRFFRSPQYLPQNR